MRLIEMNWPEVEAYLEIDNRIILPIGSTEQHGPRAPLGTDHRIVHALARELSARTGVITAPTIPFGMSIHHMEFPGTLTLNPSTMILMLKDVLTSLDYHGFRSVLLLNGHGGNRGVLTAALSEITNSLRRLRVRFVCWWDTDGVREMIREMFGSQDGHHSTPSEISLMMHFYKDFVKDLQLGYHPMPERNHFSNPDNFRELFPDGIMGANPDLATPEHGRALAEKILSSLEIELEKLAKKPMQA